jgi:phenylpropionate dioxygenase-like ring-hydroxylating dioxygenase large terminal subunit
LPGDWREQALIPNQWYAVFESRSLTGKPVGIERLGERLVAWRTDAGEAVVQRDRCSHKGARLSLGRIADGCIECPYHGLRFDATGACRLAPFMGRQFDIPSTWRVEAYPTREACGLVWVWYGNAEPADELPWFEGLPPGGGRTWQTQSIWPYHYTRLMDSNFDIYHFPFVHRSLNPGLGPVVVDQQVEDHGDHIDMRVTLGADSDGPANGLAEGRTGRRARKEFVLKVRMPNLLYLEMSPRFRLLAIMTPVDEERTWVFARYYADVPFGRLAAWIGGRFEYGLVQRQDRRILDTLPSGRLELGDYAYGTVDAGSRLWSEKRDRLRRAGEA